MKQKFSELLQNEDCLFRYRSYTEDTITALENNRLYFSKPSYFNDPYDTLIYINSQKIINEIIGSILCGMDSYLERKHTDNNLAVQVTNFLWKQEQSKQYLLDERIKQLYSAMDTVRGNIRKNTKVICFSEKYDSMLMWSHYADYHRGFCIMYRKKDLKNARRYANDGNEILNKIVLASVEYVQNQMDLTEDVLEYIRHNMSENMGDVPQVDSSISSKKIRKVITEKSEIWSYEKEWRLVPRIPKIEIESPLAYIECPPLAVIVGSKCMGENRNRIIRLCKKYGIPLYGIFLKENDPSCRLEINDEGNLDLAFQEYYYCYNE